MSSSANLSDAAIVPEQEANPKAAPKWTESKWLILAELAVVAGIFVADAHHLIFFSKTPYLLAFGWLSLLVRRVGWRGIGLTRYKTWAITLGLGIAAGIAMEAFELFVSQPLLVHWLHKQPDLDVFRDVTGNLQHLLIYLALIWPLAAFGEEMVYRGYLMNRVADLFNRTRGAWIISVVAVHVGFGLAHGYQGITGILDEALMGVLLAVLYLATGRNLAVPIVAHGISDTIDFVLIYLGIYPGM